MEVWRYGCYPCYGARKLERGRQSIWGVACAPLLVAECGSYCECHRLITLVGAYWRREDEHSWITLCHCRLRNQHGQRECCPLCCTYSRVDEQQLLNDTGDPEFDRFLNSRGYKMHQGRVTQSVTPCGRTALFAPRRQIMYTRQVRLCRIEQAVQSPAIAKLIYEYDSNNQNSKF